MAALVERYGRSPYNVRYWELGNEPDVDPSLVSAHSGFGCWGDKDDPYYGGRYYAEMLKVAYPAIKRADPRAQVLIGGLLLDCDPEDPDCSEPPHDPDNARFLEGILENGAGDYFDIVSFHGYPGGSLQQDMNLDTWDQRGGVVLGKIDYLREVMADYGVDKPLMHTEGSLGITCDPSEPNCDPPNDAFYESQADYVVWLFVRNWAEGLLGTIWYPFDGPGWRLNGMLDANQEPRQAYVAYEFLTETLSDMSYDGRLTQFPELQAFSFHNLNRRVWVLWTTSDTAQVFTLPVSTQVVYDKYGNDITPTGDDLWINSPVYVEMSP
jgi:hypothetical protein